MGRSRSRSRERQNYYEDRQRSRSRSSHHSRSHSYQRNNRYHNRYSQSSEHNHKNERSHPTELHSPPHKNDQSNQQSCLKTFKKRVNLKNNDVDICDYNHDYSNNSNSMERNHHEWHHHQRRITQDDDQMQQQYTNNEGGNKKNKKHNDANNDQNENSSSFDINTERYDNSSQVLSLGSLKQFDNNILNHPHRDGRMNTLDSLLHSQTDHTNRISIDHHHQSKSSNFNQLEFKRKSIEMSLKVSENEELISHPYGTEYGLQQESCTSTSTSLLSDQPSSTSDICNHLLSNQLRHLGHSEHSSEHSSSSVSPSTKSSSRRHLTKKLFKEQNRMKHHHDNTHIVSQEQDEMDNPSKSESSSSGRRRVATPQGDVSLSFDLMSRSSSQQEPTSDGFSVPSSLHLTSRQNSLMSSSSEAAMKSDEEAYDPTHPKHSPSSSSSSFPSSTSLLSSSFQFNIPPPSVPLLQRGLSASSLTSASSNGSVLNHHALHDMNSQHFTDNLTSSSSSSSPASSSLVSPTVAMMMMMNRVASSSVLSTGTGGCESVSGWSVCGSLNGSSVPTSPLNLPHYSPDEEVTDFAPSSPLDYRYSPPCSPAVSSASSSVSTFSERVSLRY